MEWELDAVSVGSGCSLFPLWSVASVLVDGNLKDNGSYRSSGCLHPPLPLEEEKQGRERARESQTVRDVRGWRERGEELAGERGKGRRLSVF